MRPELSPGIFMVNKTKQSEQSARDAGGAELTSQDVKNILNLINGAEIKVEQAEVVVQLKIKLATYHNRLLAVERGATKQ